MKAKSKSKASPSPKQIFRIILLKFELFSATMANVQYAFLVFHRLIRSFSLMHSTLINIKCSLRKMAFREISRYCLWWLAVLACWRRDAMVNSRNFARFRDEHVKSAGKFFGLPALAYDHITSRYPMTRDARSLSWDSPKIVPHAYYVTHGDVAANWEMSFVLI